MEKEIIQEILTFADNKSMPAIQIAKKFNLFPVDKIYYILKKHDVNIIHTNIREEETIGYKGFLEKKNEIEINSEYIILE